MSTFMPLGRIESPDSRDANFPMKAALPRRIAAAYRSKPWKLGPVLNQSSIVCPGSSVYPDNDHTFCEEFGFCVGYSGRSWMDSQPIRTKGGPNALDQYHGAQLFDEFRGTRYAGTSVRGLMKYLQSQGRIESYVWAEGAQDVADFVRTKGTAIAGTDWTENMFWPDKSTGYLLDCGGVSKGGHAYEIVWFYKRITLGGKTHRNIFKKKGSWGDWAENGFAYIRFEDLDRLIRNGGECVAPLERKII